MRMIMTGLVGWFTVAVAAGCATGDSCGVVPPAARAAPATAPVAAVATPAATTQPAGPALDQVVIETVLADLLTLKDSPLKVKGGPPREILFAERAATYAVTEEGIIQRHAKEQWAALSQRELDAAGDAAWDVVRRHASGEGFEPFRPRDPRVKIQVQSDATTRRWRLEKRPVHAWPPGYTSDGGYAVVYLSIPWSMHHAKATYLLERDGDAWRVRLRQFVYYF